jgi:hypothetical protein
LQQSTKTHIVTGDATLAISQRIAIRGSVPVIYSKSEDQGQSASSTDLGDLSVSLQRYSTPRLFGKPVNLFYGVGVTLPVGQGISNPITDEQNFASGTVDPFINLLGVIGLSPVWSLNGSFYTRQIVGSSSQDSRSGDFYSGAVGLNYHPPTRGTIVNVQTRFIKRGQDRYDGALFANSGGDWTYLDIGITRDVIGTGEQALQLWALFGLPVYQFVEGTQLTESWNLRVGATIGVTLFGSHGDEPTGVFGH